MDSVKVLVGYHKPSVLLKNDVFVPIHLGRAVAKERSKDGVISDQDLQWLLDNTIGDDTGDNISSFNRSYCEMTGIYWAWKNYEKLGNPDYIGFTHYRRLLSLHCKDSEKDVAPKLDYKFFHRISNDQKFANHYLSIVNNDLFNKALEHHKAIMPSAVLATAAERNREREADHTFTKLIMNHPNKPDWYDPFIKEYMANEHNYYTNIFVLRREDFFHYCEQIFSMLNDVYPIIKDVPRSAGYIAERITSVLLQRMLTRDEIYESTVFIPYRVSMYEAACRGALLSLINVLPKKQRHDYRAKIKNYYEAKGMW